MATSLTRLLKDPLHCLSLGFGTGLMPIAPGTAGTLIAIPIYGLLQGLSLAHYLIFILIAALFGCYLCQRTAKVLKRPDPPQVVWDEMVGYWFTMIAAPYGWRWIFMGFILFRIFDIVKPWPISWLERSLPGGFGIMMDDIAAGLCAAACLQIFVWIGFTFGL